MKQKLLSKTPPLISRNNKTFVPHIKGFDWIMCRKELSCVQKLVYCQLIKFYYSESNYKPSYPDIAKWLGIKKRTVIRSIAVLETNNLIKTIKHNGSYNEYIFYHHKWIDEYLDSINILPSDEISLPCTEENNSNSNDCTNNNQEYRGVPEGTDKSPPHKEEAKCPLSPTRDARMSPGGCQNVTGGGVRMSPHLLHTYIIYLLYIKHMSISSNEYIDVSSKHKLDIEIQELFEMYMKESGRDARYKLTSKRKSLLRKGLKFYSKEDCIKIIKGCLTNPYNNGENKQGKKYINLELIFRDEEKMQQYLDFYEFKSPVATGNTKKETLQDYFDKVDEVWDEIKKEQNNRQCVQNGVIIDQESTDTNNNGLIMS